MLNVSERRIVMASGRIIIKTYFVVIIKKLFKILEILKYFR